MVAGEEDIFLSPKALSLQLGVCFPSALGVSGVFQCSVYLLFLSFPSVVGFFCSVQALGVGVFGEGDPEVVGLLMFLVFLRNTIGISFLGGL